MLPAAFKPPRWRTALVCEKEGNRYVLAVQLGTTEEDMEEDQGTLLSCEGKSLLLVQAREDQLRSDAPSSVFPLEVGDRAIMKRFFAVDEGELSYTSATDDPGSAKDARIKNLEAELRRLKNQIGAPPKVGEDEGDFQDVEETL